MSAAAVSPAPLGWLGIFRLGLVQTALGAIVLIVTSSMNRVMVVELALPAMVPGALVALHYAVQLLRPRLGYGADRGGRRTPWIVGGMAVLAAGGLLAALATAWMSTNLAAGLALAVPAFVLVGLGVGAAGTSLLLLLASRVTPARRPAAATIVWLMMLFGFAATAAFIGWQLSPFSPQRLIAVTAMVVLGALAMTGLAVWRIEGAPAETLPAQSPSALFSAALAQVWSEPRARRFTLFVFAAMFAYSAQELILEPFAGMVFARSPAESARLAGLLHGGVFTGMLLAAIVGSLRPRPDAMRHWAVGGCLAAAVAMLALTFSGLAGPSWPLNLNVVVLGIANGSFVTAAISTMMALASEGRPGHAGVRMGLWGAAQAIAFALGGLAGSTASDLARALFGTPVPAYAAVFLGEAALFLAAAWQAEKVFSRGPRLTAEIPYETASLVRR